MRRDDNQVIDIQIIDINHNDIHNNQIQDNHIKVSEIHEIGEHEHRRLFGGNKRFVIKHPQG